jgi:hypothetical protein
LLALGGNGKASAADVVPSRAAPRPANATHPKKARRLFGSAMTSASTTSASWFVVKLSCVINFLVSHKILPRFRYKSCTGKTPVGYQSHTAAPKVERVFRVLEDAKAGSHILPGIRKNNLQVGCISYADAKISLLQVHHNAAKPN